MISHVISSEPEYTVLGSMLHLREAIVGDDLPVDEILETLVVRLQDLEAALTAQLSASSEAAAPVDLEQPFGRLSRMDAIQQQQMVRAARAGKKIRLQQTKAARMRVQRGEYGLCIACDDEIELKRLQARPETPYCYACQDEMEARQKSMRRT